MIKFYLKAVGIFSALLIFVCPQLTHGGQEYRFAVTPIPKCGTHLLFKCINLIDPDIKIQHWVAPDSYRLAQIELLRIQENRAVPHMFFHRPFVENLLIDLDYNWIAMYRDPRDACISLVFYMQKFTGNNRDFFWVSDEWDSLSFDDQLYSVIVGGDYSRSYLKEYFNKSLPWSKKSPRALTVRFEDLIGSKGDGDDARQRIAIIKIAKHIGTFLSHEKMDDIVDQLFNERPSQSEGDIEFSRGQIGNWRYFFSERHKKAFKKIFGKELIKLGYESKNNW